MDSLITLLCSLLVYVSDHVCQVHVMKILVVASNAALLPAEVYWRSVLPNARMPTAISDLLSSDTVLDSKTGTTVKVGNGGVYGKPHPRVTHSFLNYIYAATEDQLDINSQLNFFFLERDLHPGSKIIMEFEKINADMKFLPRSEAETIPFSSMKLPEIISRFSVQPGSDEEEAIKETLKECEDPALNGEKKMCATSLESMVDFSVTSLGTKNVKAVSTIIHSKYDETLRQEYTIDSSGVKNLAGDELVACHKRSYAYAAYYCHLTKSTKGYTVKMTGKDGTMVDAAVVCHTDTSAWNPKHVAFQVLNVKPGTVPVCHFLPQDHVVFSHNM